MYQLIKWITNWRLQEDNLESLNASLCDTGVVGDFSVSSTPFVNTEAIEASKSIACMTVSVEAKAEDTSQDFPRTRANPKNSSDKKPDKENRTEILSPSTIQDIEVDDTIYSEEDIPKWARWKRQKLYLQ